MKKIILAFIAVMLLVGNRVYAEPERLQITQPEQKIKKEAAKAGLKKISLQNIEDPEARKAIREILNYLNLKAGD